MLSFVSFHIVFHLPARPFLTYFLRHVPRLHNLPILVGGRAGGRLATGQHLLYGRDTPLSNLYLAILDALDCPQQRFADSTERLPGVLV